MTKTAKLSEVMGTCTKATSGVWVTASKKRWTVKVGKVSCPANTIPHGKGRAYNRNTGSYSVGVRFSDEGIVAIMVSDTITTPSKGPLD